MGRIRFTNPPTYYPNITNRPQIIIYTYICVPHTSKYQPRLDLRPRSHALFVGPIRAKPQTDVCLFFPHIFIGRQSIQTKPQIVSHKIDAIFCEKRSEI